MNLPKKISIILFSVFLFFTFFPSSASGQEESNSWAVRTPEKFMECVTATFDKDGKPGQKCGDAYSGMYVTDNLVYGLSCKLSGWPCSNDIKLDEIFQEQSFMYKTNNMIAALYDTPPASTQIWLADVSSNLGLIPKAYAQGVGFYALSPVIGIWKVMRNVAYGILIIVLLFVGLMIMFRKKIDARTVISIQAALPRIVMTLILITFSYPIAALLIDFMYVIMFFGVSVIGPQAGLTPPQIIDYQSTLANGQGLSYIWATVPTRWWVLGGVSAAVGFASIALTPLLLPVGTAGRGLFQIGTLFKAAPFVSKATLGKVGAVLGSTGGIMFLFVVLLFLFSLLRIWFMLLNAYINILINIIFAPIFILGQAIPGENQFQFSSWLRNLVANLIVFPATAILILVARAVSWSFYGPYIAGNPSGDVSWTPPMLGFGHDLAEALIGIGFALVIPTLVSSIKKMIGAKPIVSLGGAVAGIGGQPIGIGQQVLSTLGQYKLVFGGGRPGRS